MLEKSIVNKRKNKDKKRKIFFRFYLFLFCVCGGIFSAFMTMHHACPEEGIGSPWTRVANGCELLYGYFGPLVKRIGAFNPLDILKFWVYFFVWVDFKPLSHFVFL